jgi:hypothetical protein
LERCAASVDEERPLEYDDDFGAVADEEDEEEERDDIVGSCYDEGRV